MEGSPPLSSSPPLPPDTSLLGFFFPLSRPLRGPERTCLEEGVGGEEEVTDDLPFSPPPFPLLRRKAAAPTVPTTPTTPMLMKYPPSDTNEKGEALAALAGWGVVRVARDSMEALPAATLPPRASHSPTPTAKELCVRGNQAPPPPPPTSNTWAGALASRDADEPWDTATSPGYKARVGLPKALTTSHRGVLVEGRVIPPILTTTPVLPRVVVVELGLGMSRGGRRGRAVRVLTPPAPPTPTPPTPPPAFEEEEKRKGMSSVVAHSNCCWAAVEVEEDAPEVVSPRGVVEFTLPWASRAGDAEVGGGGEEAVKAGGALPPAHSSRDTKNRADAPGVTPPPSTTATSPKVTVREES